LLLPFQHPCGWVLIGLHFIKPASPQEVVNPAGQFFSHKYIKNVGHSVKWLTIVCRTGVTLDYCQICC